MKMTGMQRVRSLLQGERLDRSPYSFWTHLPSVDLDPVKLAEETYRFYKTYELDFIKTMPNGLFSVEDFGCECDYSEIPLGGVAKITRFGVQSPEGWLRLKKPSVTEGALGRELESIRLLLAKVRGEAPVVATVFTPLTTAAKLCGPVFAQHMLEHPEKLRKGLEAIAEVTIEFAREALRQGCAGIFLANQKVDRKELTEQQYLQFAAPYDKQVLTAIQAESWFNVLHIHGNDTHYRLMYDYPVQAFNWHIGETAPSVAEFREALPGAVIVGGLQRYHITNGQNDKLRKDIEAVTGLIGTDRLILTPGCVIRYPVQPQVLHQLKNDIGGYPQPQQEAL